MIPLKYLIYIITNPVQRRNSIFSPVIDFIAWTAVIIRNSYISWYQQLTIEFCAYINNLFTTCDQLKIRVTAVRTKVRSMFMSASATWYKWLNLIELESKMSKEKSKFMIHLTPRTGKFGYKAVNLLSSPASDKFPLKWKSVTCQK